MGVNGLYSGHSGFIVGLVYMVLGKQYMGLK